MSCPHSTAPGADPKKCSQCMMAKAKIITYDPDTRALLEDGQIKERETEVTTFVPPNKGSVGVSGRRPATCGICGEVGHTRKKCDGKKFKTN